jgi:hypothetical protein
MRAHVALALLGVLALAVPASAQAKGFTRVVLIGSDGHSVELRANESAIDGLLSRRGSLAEPRGGYVRLFFVGAGDFPANPARYYPVPQCVALDWPSYERSCRRVNPTLVRRLRPAQALARFQSRPTVLAQITDLGKAPNRRLAALLKSPVELALGGTGRPAPRPRLCYGFTGRWRGPAAADRPRRFFLCRDGVYADRRLHPLGRGVWQWFRLNAGPEAVSRRSP